MSDATIRLFTIPRGARLEQTDEGAFMVFLRDGSAKLIDVTLTGAGAECVETVIPPLKLSRDST
jgi:hypothetical protein